MSSTTKKPKINPTSKKFVESNKTTDDLYRDYTRELNQISRENERKKMAFVKDVQANAEIYTQEIEEKFKEEENKRIDNIKFIHKKRKKEYSLKELNLMSFEETEKIVIEINESSKPFFRRFIELFSVD